MQWIIPVILIVLAAVLFALLRKNGSVRREIYTCLQETGDAARLAELLKNRGLRALGTDAEADDARFRLCRMQKDTAAMEQALKKMNSRPTPIQLDYLWGVDRFFYALHIQDLADMKKAMEYVSQVADRGRKKKLEQTFSGMEAVIALLEANRTEAAMNQPLTRLLSAFGTETGFSSVEEGWILEDLAAFGIRISVRREEV